MLPQASPGSYPLPGALLLHELCYSISLLLEKTKALRAGRGEQGQRGRSVGEAVGSALHVFIFELRAALPGCGMHPHGRVAGLSALLGLGGLSLPEYFRPIFFFLNTPQALSRQHLSYFSIFVLAYFLIFLETGVLSGVAIVTDVCASDFTR